MASRRRHTRCSRDWSSDVCSSDLPLQLVRGHALARLAHDVDREEPLPERQLGVVEDRADADAELIAAGIAVELSALRDPRDLVGVRSEERRVGKECRARWSAWQAEDGIRDVAVTGVQTCALPIFRFNWFADTPLRDSPMT